MKQSKALSISQVGLPFELDDSVALVGDLGTVVESTEGEIPLRILVLTSG